MNKPGGAGLFYFCNQAMRSATAVHSGEANVAGRTYPFATVSAEQLVAGPNGLALP